MDTDVQSTTAGQVLPPGGNHRKRWLAFQRPGFWRASLIMASSAALGGVPVVLWNRKILRTISREPVDREE